MAEYACFHRELDGQNRCRQCGAGFVRVWQELRAVTYVPLIFSLVATGVFAALLLGLFGTPGNPTGQLLLTLVFVYFMWRTMRGVLDLFSRHVTYMGKVERIVRRAMWNPFSSRDAQVHVGHQRFNLSDEAMRTLKEGEQALFEYLRWSRTVLAIYKPTRR